MQQGEKIFDLTHIVVDYFVAINDKCSYKPDKEKGEANLKGHPSELGKRLGKEPDFENKEEPERKNISYQAHHLIPDKSIEKHPIIRWLKKDNDFIEEKVLHSDTYYNIDHSNNGEWMPNAGNLTGWTTKTDRKVVSKSHREQARIEKKEKGWRKAASVKNKEREADEIKKNEALNFNVMRWTNIQIHDGNHQQTASEIIQTPYQERVKEYLNKVNDSATLHCSMIKDEPVCGECYSKKEDEKYPPRKNTVEHVDVVSELLRGDIEHSRIFVSKVAAKFHNKEKFKPPCENKDLHRREQEKENV